MYCPFWEGELLISLGSNLKSSRMGNPEGFVESKTFGAITGRLLHMRLVPSRQRCIAFATVVE